MPEPGSPREVIARLADAMDSAGQKKVELAAACNISEQAVGQWFKTGRISTQNLATAARVCGVTLDWLVTGEEPRSRAALSVEATEFAALFAQCPPSQRADLMKSARALVRGMIADDREEASERNKNTPQETPNGARSLPENRGAAVRSAEPIEGSN